MKKIVKRSKKSKRIKISHKKFSKKILKHRYKGRKPSNKSKDSKVKKLIRLAKIRAKSKKSKKSARKRN